MNRTKRLLTLLLLVCGMTTGIRAQTAQLTRDGYLVKTFTGASSLSSAISAAASKGDIIVLSSGSFSNPGNITKSVSIYGQGFENSTAIGGARTYISGKLVYNLMSEGALDGIHLEGLYIEDDLNILTGIGTTAVIDDFTVKKCHSGGVYFYQRSTNVKLQNCKFDRDVRTYPDPYTTTMQVDNCYIEGNLFNFADGSNVIVNNSLIHNNHLQNYSAATSFNNCIIYKNISNGSSATKCIFNQSSVSGSTDNCWMGVNNGDIYVAEGEDGSYGESKSFAVKDTYVGTDNTPVGLQGGIGWNKTPTIPSYLTPEDLPQDAEGYYLLDGKMAWLVFAALVNGGTYDAKAKMTDDIDLGDDQTMIGSGSNPYKGTFDGDGHKLTVHYVNPSEGFIGPFTKVQNSIIKNLHVAGSITTENRFTGAIVGTVANGTTCTLQNCRSSVACQFTHVGDSYVQSGGIFGTVNENATLTMTDCLFDGSLSTMVSSKGMGGMVGWNYKGTVNMDNCLFAPQSVDVNTENIYTLIGSSSVSINHITNCYYATSIGTVQGTQATAEQLADGTITYKLQNNREDLVWGQRIGTDAEPVLTNDESYRVYRSINGGYTNDPTLVYEGLQKDVNDNYLLGCVWDWKEFAEIVNSGTNNTANAKMTADIDLGDDQTMIGSESNPYKGTFDGCGHSIHVSITGNEEIGSPFRCISSATIKNVKVTGSVLGGIHCSGLVGVALSGTCTISNCEVAVSVTCNSTHCGGIIGHGRSSNTTIENCLFSGSISGPTTATGIFYGWGDGGTHNIVNCLSAGNYTGSSGVNLACGYGITITNCYRKTSGGSQGTDASSMTATELATALNNGGQEVWVQDPITNQPMLAIFANAVTLSDGDDLSALSAYAGKTCKVAYSRSFTAGKSSTICLPFAFAKGSVGKFYTFTGITHEGSNYEATMTEYTDANLVANTPYLFTPSATGSVDFGGTYTLPASITAGSTTSGDWTYLGTYETISWTEAPTGIYGFSAQAVGDIQQGEFVKVGAYVRIKPMRCYLKYKNGLANYAGARGMTRAADEPLPETIKVRLIGADGEVTGIGSLQTKTCEVTFDKDTWYSLDGRRIEGKPTVKGIYVNNGKKVIIK